MQQFIWKIVKWYKHFCILDVRSSEHLSVLIHHTLRKVESRSDSSKLYWIAPLISDLGFLDISKMHVVQMHPHRC